ncbi:cilia- and flagella-associated protein 53-like [Maniola hyperantus]|uniref:cilia- and flagella-associated protein 53-like n=1 Tax=Aphantopus hyperantus TaxID=2795564 RepID=UPI00374A49B2
MAECGYCKEKESKIEKYEEEIKKEKERECLKALEREKIANGMRCTKRDEIDLRRMQQMQMHEKKLIEQNQAEVDELWHQVLVNDVKIKEEIERAKAERLKQEMRERRMAYDEQIASAHRKRQEALQNERAIENRRLERMKKKMEQDYYDAIKRKRDQQLLNKQNFIDGHQIKLSRINSEKRHEREMDLNTINVAMEELRREKQKKLHEIQMQKIREDIFVENFSRERRIADELEDEASRIACEWKEQDELESDEIIRKTEREKQNNKLKAAQEYKCYLERRNHELETKKHERKATMDRVKRMAYNELRKNLDSANEELRRQIEYKNTLTNQIRENQTIMELELNGMERKQRPFTKKAIMFKEAMQDKVGQLDTSENPVHPFKKMLQIHKVDNRISSLPFINK